MGKLVLAVALALAGALLGVVLRLAGVSIAPPVAALVFGVAIVAAGFLLSWGAEAETHASQGLVIAVLALVTVLPEYSVDIYLAFQAGANHLLVGVMWPLLVLLVWWGRGQRGVPLGRDNAPEVAFLASLYAFVIVVKGRIDLVDFVLLAGLFGVYVWRVSLLLKGEDEAADGPAAVLARLP